MIRAFLDTSILLSRLFNQHPQLSQEDWDRIENPIVSEFAQIEARRVIERYKIVNSYDDAYFASALSSLNTLLSGISQVALEKAIFARASQPFGLILGTLDALHLSTALILREQNPDETWIFYTHDEQLKRAAISNGFTIKG